MAIPPSLQYATNHYTTLHLNCCSVNRNLASVHNMQKRKKMMPLSVRLDEDVRKALEKIAEADDRSLSYMVNLAAREYVETGYGPC